MAWLRPGEARPGACLPRNPPENRGNGGNEGTGWPLGAPKKADAYLSAKHREQNNRKSAFP